MAGAAAVAAADSLLEFNILQFVPDSLLQQ